MPEAVFCRWVSFSTFKARILTRAQFYGRFEEAIEALLQQPPKQQSSKQPQ